MGPPATASRESLPRKRNCPIVVEHAAAKVFVVLGKHYSTVRWRFEPSVNGGPWGFLSAGDDLAPAHGLEAAGFDSGSGVAAVLTRVGADLSCPDVFTVAGGGTGEPGALF